MAVPLHFCAYYRLEVVGVKERLKRNTPVYYTEIGFVREKKVTVVPSVDKPYYKVSDIDERLPEDISEWPDYLHFDRQAAEKDAERRFKEIQRQLEHWQEIVLGSPRGLLIDMFRAWAFLQFHSRRYLDVPVLDTGYTRIRKREMVVQKIREYFGIDLDEDEKKE